jgi:hypothetical protein
MADFAQEDGELTPLGYGNSGIQESLAFFVMLGGFVTLPFFFDSGIDVVVFLVL